jgi:hypothetical protein
MCKYKQPNIYLNINYNELNSLLSYIHTQRDIIMKRGPIFLSHYFQITDNPVVSDSVVGDVLAHARDIISSINSCTIDM